MKIHHLNCGSFCPVGKGLMQREGGLLDRGCLVCHCLLIEGKDGLVLVDTGFGTDDVRHAKTRLGRMFIAVGSPRLDEGECAVRQVEALGFSASDVRDILITHLDLDHAGGLGDFPGARVHLYGPEHDAATSPKTWLERERYRAVQWAHGPKWVKHALGGDTWHGFDSVKPLSEGQPDVAIVPLLGHTRGHSGIAVRGDDGWLLHAGDAYYFHEEMIPDAPYCPPALSLFQRMFEADRKARLGNQQRLRDLRKKSPEVRIFSAHDHVELARFSPG